MLFKVKLIPAVLGAIVLFALMARIINLNFNSVFLDEAIYIILGKKILDFKFEEVAGSISWVGGFPFFYPLISGIFYSFGGILGSRLINVILGTVCVVLIYFFSKNLKFFSERKFNEICGLIAASILATAAIPVAFSRIAIYDTLAFTLFLLSMVILQSALVSRKKYLFLVSALILFFAFLTKYIVFVFLTFGLCLIWYVTIGKKLKKETLENLKLFWLPLIFLVAFYFWANFTSLVDFFKGQVFSEKAPPGEVISTFLYYSWHYYLLSFGGLLFLLLKKYEKSLLVILLFASSLIPLVVHIVTGDISSVGQHTFLSLIFILPIIGFLFGTVFRNYSSVGFLIVSFLIFTNIYLSIPKVVELQSFWPNTTGAVNFLKERVDRNSQILAEGGDVVSLAVYDKVAYENIAGPFYFEYDGLFGWTAYLKATEDKYFNFLELDGTNFSREQILELETRFENRYGLIFDDGAVKIYQSI